MLYTAAAAHRTAPPRAAHSPTRTHPPAPTHQNHTHTLSHPPHPNPLSPTHPPPFLPPPFLRGRYRNPYSQPLRLGLHTDAPEHLQLPRLLYAIAPGTNDKIALCFVGTRPGAEPRAQPTQARAPP